MYQFELSSSEEVRHEYEQWKTICANMPERNRPSSPLHALDIVPPRLRNIQILLHILCLLRMLPVITCTPERAFSVLKLLKNYLRNSMSDARLTGLALMYIHPDINIDVSDVVRRFMSMPAKIEPSNTQKRAADDAGENMAPGADPDRRRWPLVDYRIGVNFLILYNKITDVNFHLFCL
jgi:hAT family C-terminal dimerisation region